MDLGSASSKCRAASVSGQTESDLDLGGPEGEHVGRNKGGAGPPHADVCSMFREASRLFGANIETGQRL